MHAGDNGPKCKVLALQGSHPVQTNNEMACTGKTTDIHIFCIAACLINSVLGLVLGLDTECDMGASAVPRPWILSGAPNWHCMKNDIVETR